MDERLTLHNLLLTAFPNVPALYLPSGNITLTYPCIVYQPEPIEPKFANNTPFTSGKAYQVTIMTNLPPNEIDVTPMFTLSGVVVRHVSVFVSTDILHNVFRVFFN